MRLSVKPAAVVAVKFADLRNKHQFAAGVHVIPSRCIGTHFARNSKIVEKLITDLFGESVLLKTNLISIFAGYYLNLSNPYMRKNTEMKSSCIFKESERVNVKTVVRA